MCSVTGEQCETILNLYFHNKSYQLIDFYTKSASDASVGLLSAVYILNAKVRVTSDDNAIPNHIQVRFFIKSIPSNQFHNDFIKKSNCYKKEAAFFGTMFSGMRKFLSYKSIPKCYLPDCETMIVLEDLSMAGFRNSTNPIGIDLKHTYVSLKALADIHAASLLFENEAGKKWDEICPTEILRPWWTEIEDYPGYLDNIAAAKVVSKVIDKYFSTKYSQTVLNEAKQMLFDFCKRMQKSEKYRNVISHQDLWCNNIMYKYDSNEEVEEAVIIDFQIIAYNPPSLDLLMLIFCNTDKATRDKHLHTLIDYYYQCLSDNISAHNVDPDQILSYQEFRASMQETLPTALLAAPIYLHTVTIPDQEMITVIGDIDKLKYYITQDRTIVLELMDKYEEYKDRVLIATQDLLDYLNKTHLLT